MGERTSWSESWWAGLAVGVSLALPAQAQVQAPAYRLEPAHTSVHWEVLHMETSTIRGRFDRLEGQARFDPEAHVLEVSIIVDTASVSTGSPSFDAVLRGPSLLSTQAHPQAFFTARRARWEGAVPREVQGEITLRGVSRPLTFKTVRWKCGFNPLFRAQVCGGDLEATLARTDFDLQFGSPFAANEVQLRIQVEALPVSSTETSASSPTP